MFVYLFICLFVFVLCCVVLWFVAMRCVMCNVLCVMCNVLCVVLYYVFVYDLSSRLSYYD